MLVGFVSLAHWLGRPFSFLPINFPKHGSQGKVIRVRTAVIFVFSGVCYSHRHLFSIQILHRVEELQAEYKEEEITLKGYVKRLRSLLDSHLMETHHEDIAQLERRLRDADITEVRYLTLLTTATAAFPSIIWFIRVMLTVSLQI